MNIYYTAIYNSLSSKDKTDISSQIHSSKKLRKNMNKLKKKINFLPDCNIKINSFHKNSMRNLLHTNLKKLYYNEIKDFNSTLPDLNCKNLYSSNTNSDRSYKKIFFERANSNRNILTISPLKYSKRKNKSNKNIFQNKLSNNENFEFSKEMNKSERNLNIFRKNFRCETISQFNKKSKEIVLTKYLQNIQKKELENIKDEIKTKISLYDMEIERLIKIINLIKTFINEEKNYSEYLRISLKEEKEINEFLIEKRNDALKENFLLKDKLGKIERKFSKYLNNKFFLLCVKNGTNQIEKFPEEEKNDYLLDLDTLDKLSNYSIIQYKLDNEILKKEIYSGEEIEKFVFGRKLFKEQKNIFNSIKEYNIKLKKIENDIQNYLILYNQTQKELDSIRNIFKEKVNLIEEENLKDKNYKEELKRNFDKLNELKFRNNHLNYYIKKMKKKNNKKKNKDNFKLVEEKIIEVYNKINSVFPIPININVDEKITLKNYLEIIEITFNKLYLKKEKNKKNFFIYIKKAEKLNKLKSIEILKEKERRESEEKVQKVINKSKKIIFKSFRKVPIVYNINNKKQKIKEKEDDLLKTLDEYI